MTLDQAYAFGILGVTGVLFVWGRLPYDLVALLALAAGVALGVVPMQQAFSGFADDIVILIGAALLVSAAVARSGAVEAMMRPVLPRLTTPQVQVTTLAGAVLVASIFTKNIGALAIFIPVALQLARRTGTPASAMLMPMAFASLIGGLVTMIGTSPNIIVSRVREEATGQPFGMFDYTPVGLGIALAGLGFLAFGWRLLPRERSAALSMGEALALEGYAAEARLIAGSTAIGTSIAEFEAMAEGRVTVGTVMRRRLRRHAPPPGFLLEEGDVLILEGEPEDLESLVARAKLHLAGEKPAAPTEDEARVVEAVVTADSPMAGATAATFALRDRFGASLLAVSRRGQRIAQRINTLRLVPGDVLILKGPGERLPEALSRLRLLPLAGRDIPLGRSRRSWLPVIVLGLAVLAVALQLLPVAIAFFFAALAMLVLRSLTMQEAYEAIEWPVLILLGALIPVSEAIRTTGGTDLIAGWLSLGVQHLPPVGALAAIMVVAMAVTPFLNNAATVLMLGPIAASLAARLGLAVDPFLMAVAVGAACDFLTPIGHQCNTLVMGPGGYRFTDYPRLGLPLSLLVVLVGVPLIAFVWPLTGG